MLNFVYPGDVEFYSPNYFTQGENEVDPLRFLEYEPVIFEVCPEQNADGQIENISAQVVCTNSDNQIELHKHSSSGCYYGNIQEVTCEGDFEVSYSQDSKQYFFSKELQITKESSVVDRVLSQDYEILNNALDLSYYLVVHNKIKGVNSKSDDIYERIRDLRDNERKCWSDNRCDIEDTTKVLYNLQLAGYDESNRLIEDGKIYLNSQIINTTLEDAEFETQIQMSSSFNGSFECEIFIDDSDDVEESIEVDEELINVSGESFSSSFEIDCEEDVDEFIFTIHNSNEKFNVTHEDDNQYKYERDDVAFCFGEDSECDKFSTLYALLAYGQDLDYYNELINYIENFKFSDSVNRDYISDDDEITLSATYSKVVQDEAVENFIKFSQNNDGSWGGGRESRRIFETYWGIEAMRELNAQSYIEDAENWMYFEEPRRGWGNIERDSLAYLSIERFIRPFLLIEYEQVLDKESTIKLSNPSIFDIQNLEINVDSQIEEFISFPKNLRTIEPDDEIEFKISRDGSILTDKKGLIKVTGIIDNEREEFISVPLIIKAPNLVTFSSNSSQFSRDKPVIEVEIRNEDPSIPLSCEYTNSFSDEQREVTLDSELNTLAIPNPDYKTGEMEVEIECTYEEDTIQTSATVRVVEQEPTFGVESEQMSGEEFVIDDFNDAQLTINSLFDEEQEITLSFENNFVGLVEISNPSFFIREDGRRVIQFSADDMDMLESFKNTTDSIVISSDTGYVERVDLRYMHNVSMSSTLIIGISLGIVVFIVIVFVGMRLIKSLRNRNQVSNATSQEFEEDDMVDLDNFDFD